MKFFHENNLYSDTNTTFAISPGFGRFVVFAEARTNGFQNHKGGLWRYFKVPNCKPVAFSF